MIQLAVHLLGFCNLSDCNLNFGDHTLEPFPFSHFPFGFVGLVFFIFALGVRILGFVMIAISSAIRGVSISHVLCVLWSALLVQLVWNFESCLMRRVGSRDLIAS